MTYRHIFFTGSAFMQGHGDITVYYTGRMYSNCTSIVNFKELYDPSQDLIITCGECARKKYKKIIKLK